MQQAPLGDRPGRMAPWLAAFVFAYIGFMLWTDSKYQLGERLADSGWVLLGLLPLIFCSFLLRYLRWRLLLRHCGRSPGFAPGLLAYLAGFALTASPGKAGELIRIRYFSRLGVPANLTIATFVFERACDLIVVLGLSLLVAAQLPAFGMLAGTILAIVAAILIMARSQRGLRTLQRFLFKRMPRWISRPASTLLGGIARFHSMLEPALIFRSLAIGTLAWLLPSVAFTALCASMGLDLPLAAALGIYPAAMLVGALSFIPGGIGTTEAAIVALLASAGVAVPDAFVVAIGIRLSTLWFATLMGGSCVAMLDKPLAPTGRA